MADERAEQERSKRVHKVLDHMVQSFCGKGMERGNGALKVRAGTATSRLTVEQVGAEVEERLAPKIRALFDAIHEFADVSLVLRLEIPTNDVVREPDGQLSQLVYTVPMASCAEDATARMRRAMKYATAGEPLNLLHEYHGQMLRFHEMSGAVRWTTEAHRNQARAERPYVGAGMDGYDAWHERTVQSTGGAGPHVD